MTSRLSARLVLREEFFELFQEVGQLRERIGSVLEVLARSPRIIEEDQVAVAEVRRMFDRFNERVDGLRARVLSFIG